MDKSCNSTGDSSALSATTTSSTGNNTGNKDHHYLRQLNKLSHKISKPTTTSAAVNQETSHKPLPPPPQLPINHQPPVYNINKNDFRNVVQRLTGSPAHERISDPPKASQQSSSRLHRIRPPPLAHVINNPPCLLNDAHRNWRPTAAPLSPLPPLPPVHAAAESPVSSYMRYLQSSMFSGLSTLAPLVSPRWCQQQQQQNSPPHPPPPPPQSAPAVQSFGCLSSPKSPYGLLSPSLLLSPTTTTTTVPLPSPKFKGH